MKRKKPLVVSFSPWIHNPYGSLLDRAIKYYGADVQDYGCKNIFFIREIFGELRRLKVVHFHLLDHYFFSPKLPKRLAKLFIFFIQTSILKIIGVKTIWVAHEIENKRDFSGKLEFTSIHFKTIGICFDKIIVHSGSIKKKLLRWNKCLKAKIVSVPHGNYISWYPNNISQVKARKELRIPQSVTVFLCFGHMARQKGFVTAIDQFLSFGRNDSYLLLAGSCPDRNLLKEINQKKQRASNILFFNERIEDNQVQLFFNAADYVLLPYEKFTVSGVAVLAMSFAKPCIAPRLGYFKDLFETGGAILYNPDENVGLRKAMWEAVSSKKNAFKLGKVNYRNISGATWENIAAEILRDS